MFILNILILRIELVFFRILGFMQIFVLCHIFSPVPTAAVTSTIIQAEKNGNKMFENRGTVSLIRH